MKAVGEAAREWPPETIYAEATSVGAAGVAVVRVSGSSAGVVLERLAGKKITPRRATRVDLYSLSGGELLDTALVLWFPRPHSFTGEDTAEFHVHGGRAVVAVLLEQAGSGGVVAAPAARKVFQVFYLQNTMPDPDLPVLAQVKIPEARE